MFLSNKIVLTFGTQRPQVCDTQHESHTYIHVYVHGIDDILPTFAYNNKDLVDPSWVWKEIFRKGQESH